VSALLSGIAQRQSGGGAIVVDDIGSLITRRHNGLPFTTAGALAVETLGTVAYWHQGIPFNAAGRIVTALNAAVDRVGNGAAPFTTVGRLATGNGAISYVNEGVAYTATGQVAIN